MTHDDGTAAMKAEGVEKCPGREMSPNKCRCACEGCKHNCGAHEPNEEPT